jgi:SAM-dependent methyltransferase
MKPKSIFSGYEGSEEPFWVRHHHKYKGSILAVGRGNTSVTVNEVEYRDARRQFESMVSTDFSAGCSTLSVLDCGFGHGHYAYACKALGCGRYTGLDFASPKRPDLGESFIFKQQDLSVPFRLDEQFDLVICIDVIFHIVDDNKFNTALENIRRHAKDKIYITSLFSDAVFRPYVKHRPLTAYGALRARHLSTAPWRDNKIARFEVTS